MTLILVKNDQSGKQIPGKHRANKKDSVLMPQLNKPRNEITRRFLKKRANSQELKFQSHVPYAYNSETSKRQPH